MIHSEVDKKLDLTINNCVDEISLKDIEDKIDQFYNGEPTLHVLWDFTQAILPSMSTEQVEILSYQVTEKGHSRDGGKTAIVASQDLVFGLGRMFGSLSSSKNHIAEVRVFRSSEEAIAWIKDDINA